MDKYALHRLLTEQPAVRRYIELEAIGSLSVPKDAVELAWREGRRSIAAEWLSIYREVEDEYERTRVG
jgi:hypothetical protein